LAVNVGGVHVVCPNLIEARLWRAAIFVSCRAGTERRGGMLGRRGMVAGLGLLAAARTARAAGLQDWTDALQLTMRFSRAGIPVDSYRSASTSMMPTLAPDDVVLADLRSARTLPARGDMVNFHPQGLDQVWLRRVIGLPGERVAVRDGQIFLGGTAVQRQFDRKLKYRMDGVPMSGAVQIETLPGRAHYETLLTSDGTVGRDVPETTVPPDRLFLMGDNRDNAMDSRFPSMRPVPVANVRGRIVYRLRPNAGWLVDAASVSGLG
jgi:signal peptidase I